jgi:hypothetical protein
MAVVSVMDRFRHLPALAQPALRRLALLLQSEKARKVQLHARAHHLCTQKLL